MNMGHSFFYVIFHKVKVRKGYKPPCLWDTISKSRPSAYITIFEYDF